MLKKSFCGLLVFICFSTIFAKSFSVKIEAGSYWKGKHVPQCAIWLTDENNVFIKTIYVTQRASKKNWIGKPSEGRPESLPVWYYNSNEDSSKIRDTKYSLPELDSITSATSKIGVDISDSYSFKEGTKYYIYVELNNSFDYNDFYTKENSGVNGQPSVVYKAEISKDSAGETKFSLAGIGSVNGADGKISENIENITTAQDIADLIIVKCN